MTDLIIEDDSVPEYDKYLDPNVNYTFKEREFIRYYIITKGRLTESAILAGYKKDIASQLGYNLTKRPHIKSVIEKIMREHFRKLDLTAERVLGELAKIAFVDPRNIFKIDNDGNMVVMSSEEMHPDDAACVQEITQTISKEGGSIKIKTYSKLDALDKLGRHLKLFTDQHEVTHNFNPMPAVKIMNGEEVMAIDFDIGDTPDHLKGLNKNK